MDCPNCRAAAPAEAAECAACGLIFAKWSEKAARERAGRILVAETALRAPEAEEDGAAARALTPRQTVLVPAAVFAAAWLLVHTDLPRFAIQAGLSMQVHEFGHALVNWLGGRLAVPIPMLTVAFSRDRAWWFASAVAAALIWLIKTAWDEGCAALAGLGAALLLVQGWLTLIASPDTLDFLVAFGGLGGECCVAAFLIIAYFHRLPKAARWPSYRAVFLFIGACVLASSLKRWRDADADFMNVPWGSFWGGDGDVEAMLGAGWTVNTLVRVYLRLTWACVGLAAFEYARAVWAVRGEIAKVTV
jgi:hypothetical protein